MTNDLASFRAFMATREGAGNAYVHGDYEPLGRIVTRVSPATFFGPRGGVVEGADEVAQRYEADAASFDAGGESHFDVRAMEASNGLAYWTGFQNATVNFVGQPGPVKMGLRITEVFRREGNDWKLVHRHADAHASEPS